MFQKNLQALFFFSILTLLTINLLDSSSSTFFASFFIYIFGLYFSFKVEKKNRNYSLKLFFTIYSIYLISAYIISLSFHNGNYFLLSDPITYLDELSINRNNSLKFYQEYFYDCYFKLADNNAIHNTYVRLLALFAKSFLDGSSVLYITLAHTGFGIFSSIVLYRILLIYFTPKKAYKYALFFSLFSLFHFYSGVIIRDIIISFFYLLVIEIVLKKFSFKNLIKLFLLLIIIWGIRLYSGLFVFVFILYYIYIPLKNSKYRLILRPPFILVVLGIFLSSAALIQQSLDEIRFYQEFSREKGEMSGGLSNYLINLPPGIKQIVLTIYSQFHPFPPYAPLLSAKTFSQIYMSTLLCISSIWWAFIFFPLVIFLFIKGTFKKIQSELKILFFIAIIFIMANTAHIDVRRMMPIYPILYLLYLININFLISYNYLKQINIAFTYIIFIAITVYFFLIA